MFKKILIASVLCSALLAGQWVSAQSTLQNGLVSYWKMDEVIGARVDSAGQNHLVNNMAMAASATGKVGNSVQFNGTGIGQAFLIATNDNSLSFVNHSFTISAWLKINTKVSMTAANKSRYEYALRYDASLDRFVFCINGIFSTVTASALGSPATNTWYHVVAWYDNAAKTKSIQVNNGTVTTVAHTTGLNVSTNDFWIGALEGWNDNWNGGIDEVKIWNRTLTAAERSQDYTNGSAGIPLTPSVPALNVYVAPTGSPAGDGSLAHPTDLQTALEIATTRGQPGGTIWLRGGTYTYRTDVDSNIRGLPNQPITIRSYPGEWAVLDGWLTLYGSEVIFRDFEIMNSNSVRDQTTGHTGLRVYASNSKCINMVVHDSIGDGVELWEQAVNSELYGCLIYRNGFWDTSQLRPRGHNIYTQNITGLKLIQNNLIFSAYDYGLHIYSTSSSIQGYLVKDNISFINGASPYRATGRANLFCGGYTPLLNVTFDGNATYHPLHALHGANEFGYVKVVNTNVTVVNNYMVGGDNTMRINQYTSPVTFTNNTTVGYDNITTIDQTAGVALSIHNINRNTYYNTEDLGSYTFIINNVVQYTFPQWQANTGLDKASTYTVGIPKSPKVIVHPNAYESGRGNIAVYNWNLQPTVNVDLSNVLAVGSSYEIRNAQDYFGIPVATGTYAGTPIAVPMSGLSAGEIFNAFVVRTVTGGSANTAPTVAISSPGNGAVYTAPATVSISVNAADPNGSISKVEIFQGANLLATLTSAPFNFAWNNVGVGSYSLTAKATDNSGAVSASSPVAINVNSAPNIPPTVSIASPANNATFTAPANITITANAADSDGTISKVEFYQGTTLLGSDATAPYSFAWNGLAAGTYSLTCKATDNSGAITTSAAVSVTVNPAPNVPPTVSIASPANSATFTAPANITITANATDSDGTISKVEFYQGTTLLGSDTTAPYSFAWNGVAVGTYSLTCKATDNSGAVTISTPVAVTINPTPNIPPSVSIASPANNSTFTAPANITITANASDSDGTITKVQFYQGSTLLATVASAPYSIAWPNVATGTYSLTVKATDNSGAVTTSTPVVVSVNPTPNVPPSVAIASPANNTTFTSPASITIAADVTDSDGTIAQVEIYDGATLLATIFSSPYNFVWNNASVGSHSLSARATDNSGASMTSALVSVDVAPVVNVPPTVSLSSSAASSILTAPADVTLTALAQDSDSGISLIEILEGNVVLGSSSVSPYNLTMTALPAGTYTFNARATDAAGGTAISSPIVVVVNAPGNPVPNLSPTVVIPSPANNSSFTDPATFTVVVNAADADGTVVLVELLDGTGVIGSSANAPYTFDLKGVMAGTYQFTARATDNSGTVTLSAPITVVVVPSQDQLPQVSITSPQTGSMLSATASISLTVSANDPDGTVAKLEYFQGRTLLAAGPGNFTSFTWNNVAAGNYTLAVRATDDLGASAWSNPVSITVAAQPSSSNFVTNVITGRIRNDFNGWLGMRFSVGSNPVTLTHLGRLFLSGNSRTHKVKLVNANTGIDIPNSIVSISMAGGTNGVFKYTALSTPISLSANTSYYLVSQEVNGGDRWAHDNSKVLTANVATCDGAALSNGSNWIFRPGLNTAMGLVDFKFIAPVSVGSLNGK